MHFPPGFPLCYSCEVGNHVACRGPDCSCDRCDQIREDALQDRLTEKEEE